jgi:hypothetical protein
MVVSEIVIKAENDLAVCASDERVISTHFPINRPDALVHHIICEAIFDWIFKHTPSLLEISASIPSIFDEFVESRS